VTPHVRSVPQIRGVSRQSRNTTAGGRLIFHVFGVLGQFERDLIRERTRAGLTGAAVRGRKGGRKPVVTRDILRKTRAPIGQGLNVREAAARLKVGKMALYEALMMSSSDKRKPVVIQAAPLGGKAGITS
jgi:DNA invertase Pin-like site-specific DNA recombinase